jgi:hypothetical protein
VQPSSSPLRELVRKRDFYAGGLMVLLGLGIALKGTTYRAGTLMHMGPGFLPTVLGIILVLLGIAIAAVAISDHDPDQGILPKDPQWMAWACVLAGPVLFIFVGYWFGMAPATFACVFVSALGDKTATWLGTFVLSTVVTVFGVGLFSYFLQVPMPILTWRGGL